MSVSLLAALFVDDLHFWIWIDLLTLASFGVPTLVRRLGVSYRRAIPWVVGASAALAVASAASGLFNGGTDEPYALPQYLGWALSGHNVYVVPLSLRYTVTQLVPGHLVAVSVDDTYVYLPLLLVLFLPGTGADGYRALAIAAWLASVYLLRRDRWTVLVLGSPVIGLLAANGFTDFVPIFFLSLAASPSVPSAARRVAALVSTGTKQFAPVLLGLHAVARQSGKRLLVTAAATVLFVAPFLVWGPAASVACAAFLLPLPHCPASYPLPAALWVHWNYYLWPVWAGAVGGPRLYRWARSPEGQPFHERARVRVHRRIGPSWRRSRDLSVLALAYGSAWVHRFRPPPGSRPAAEPLPPDEENPFRDWPPPGPAVQG